MVPDFRSRKPQKDCGTQAGSQRFPRTYFGTKESQGRGSSTKDHTDAVMHGESEAG